MEFPSGLEIFNYYKTFELTDVCLVEIPSLIDELIGNHHRVAEEI